MSRFHSGRGLLARPFLGVFGQKGPAAADSTGLARRGAKSMAAVPWIGLARTPPLRGGSRRRSLRSPGRTRCGGRLAPSGLGVAVEAPALATQAVCTFGAQSLAFGQRPQVASPPACGKHFLPCFAGQARCFAPGFPPRLSGAGAVPSALASPRTFCARGHTGAFGTCDARCFAPGFPRAFQARENQVLRTRLRQASFTPLRGVSQCFALARHLRCQNPLRRRLRGPSDPSACSRYA